jgi:hypothetical protein
MSMVHPSYDGAFYRARADRYERAAALEPDTAIKGAIEAVSLACREKAKLLDRASLPEGLWRR